MSGGLVEQRHPRLLRERTREEHPLALAAREFLDRARGKREQAEALERLARQHQVAAAFEMKRSEMRRAAHQHHLEHGEREGDRILLPDKGQSARESAPIERGKRRTEQFDRALPWIERAAEQPQQRRLARAVGPDDREHLTRLDFQ